MYMVSFREFCVAEEHLGVGYSLRKFFLVLLFL